VSVKELANLRPWKPTVGRIIGAASLFVLSALGCSEASTTCLAVPIGTGTIHGDPSTPDRIVLALQPGSVLGDSVTLVDETDLYEFVFDPSLRIVHVDGAEVARDGDLVSIGGRSPGPAGAMPIGWCGDVTRVE